MKSQHSESNELGWSDWFEQRAECKPTDTIARVAAVDREQLLLVDRRRITSTEMPAKMSNPVCPVSSTGASRQPQPSLSELSVKRPGTFRRFIDDNEA
jgi:hypothetical protein